MRKRSRRNDFEWEVSESFSRDITFKTWGQDTELGKCFRLRDLPGQNGRSLVGMGSWSRPKPLNLGDH